MEKKQKSGEGQGESNKEEHLLDTALRKVVGDDVEDNYTAELLEEIEDPEEKQKEVSKKVKRGGGNGGGEI